MQKVLKARIYNILMNLNISLTSKGVRLWAELIYQAYNKIDDFRDIALIDHDGLIKSLSRKSKMKVNSLERTLNYTLYAKKKGIKRYFDYKGIINNKTFLILVLEKLKMEEETNAERNKKANGKRITTILH